MRLVANLVIEEGGKGEGVGPAIDGKPKGFDETRDECLALRN
jgi:hypothetical protein